MINLNHTPPTRQSVLASEATEQFHSTDRDVAVTATEEPYIAHQSEARWYGNSLWEFFVPSAVTGGKLSVFQSTMPEGFGPPRHIHTREDEVFLVLEGEVWFDVDGQHLVAGPGASVYMPRGMPHTFRVKSPAARLLGIMSPGAFEQLFRNLSTPAEERSLPASGIVPFDIPAVMTEQARLGTKVVGPPMTPPAV